MVTGLNELDSEFSCTTLFNTVVVIGPDGSLLNRHRKLMPTNPERMVWGMGDASGLRVVDTPATPMEATWYATTLRRERRPSIAGSLRHFLSTPEAMKLMRSPGSGVPPSKFRPPVYVTIWS